MRFYANFGEALNEIKRELKEMGIRVHTKSVQNVDITNNADYDSFEIQNYQYLVTSPDYKSIPLKVPSWAEAEFKERVTSRSNPGTAWHLRQKYWETFIRPDGKFDYAYPDRMWMGLKDSILALKKDLSTRRAFISVFDRQIDDPHDFSCRIPCTVGYWLYYRQDQLNITYLQRSSDFFEHFNYDIYLADRLKCHIADELGVKAGTFSHWVGSLHVFQKNVEGVF